MTYVVSYTPKARKQIAKLDRAVVRRIRAFIETLDLDDPRAKGKALVDQDTWRYRIGDYRMLVHIDDGEVLVLVVEVGHRREIYRG